MRPSREASGASEALSEAEIAAVPSVKVECSSSNMALEARSYLWNTESVRVCGL